MKKLIYDIKELFNKRELIHTMASADFKKKFSGSALGIVWMFAQPIVTILIYIILFQYGFRSNPVDNMPYALWLIPGIVPWFFINEAIGGATNSLYEYQHLVKKMVFRVSILPIMKVCSALYMHAIFIWLLLSVYLLYGYMPSFWWLQALYYSFCAFVMVIAVSYFTCACNAFFKDMGQLVQVILQIGMWLAPIMWAETMFPEKYRFIVKINPVYYLVQGYRDCFIAHVGFWNHPLLTVYFWGVTAITMILGLRLFRKLRVHFADVL